MQKEVLVYDLLRGRDLDVQVASLLHADDSQQLLPQNFVVLTKLEGVLVSALDDRLTGDDRLAIGRQVGTLLAHLHEIVFDEFGYLGTEGIVETLELYVLYHWLELWDWLASTGTTAPLAGIQDELRRLSLD